jgi:Glycosyltransferase family 87
MSVTPLERPAVRRASAIILALLGLLFAVQAWRKAYRPDGNDLTSYLAASRALLEGTNPYEVATPFPYIYPLFSALVLIPFTLVPYSVAVLLWFVISAATLVWVLAWVAAREDPAGHARDAVPIAAIVLLLLAEIVQNNLLNGQVNFVVLAFCIAAIRAGSNGFASAGWWGAAIATKILPLAAAPWWLLRGRIVVVIGAVMIAVALALAPALIAGTKAFDWTAAYLRGFIGPSLQAGASADTLQFSFYWLVSHLVPDVSWLPLACALIVICGTAAADARRRSPNDDHLAFAMYLAAIPLASPKSETHHLAFVMPAAYICALRVLRNRVPLNDWRARTAILSGALFSLASLFDVARNWWWCLALVALLATLAGLLHDDRGYSGAPDLKVGPTRQGT